MLGAQRRALPKVEEIILMTEKEVMFGFPYLNGKLDYALLIGKDPKISQVVQRLISTSLGECHISSFPSKVNSASKQRQLILSWVQKARARMSIYACMCCQI